MELLWLEDFLALAETLNFSRAAEVRHVTQPAFSRRIRALEVWVGTDLLTRTTHRVALTPAGEHFRDQAAFLVRALHQLRRDTRDISGQHAAHVSIAATHALSFTFFPKWVRGNPQLLALGTLNLISDSMQACEQMMLRGDVPFLLCHAHPDVASRLDSRQYASALVGTDVLLPLSAPAPDGAPLWPLQPGRTTRLLGYSPQSGLGRILAASAALQDCAADLERSFTSHLAATLLSMARAGQGLAWLPETLAQEDILAGRLRRVGAPHHAIPIEIRLFRPIARQRDAIEAIWARLA